MARNKQERTILSGTGPYWTEGDLRQLDSYGQNRRRSYLWRVRCPYCGKFEYNQTVGECRHCGGNLYALNNQGGVE